ncbi:MAG TPA: hypothetical protein VFJ72_15390 [Rubrobacteraceae bacterium]|nr:hypothetical protein [Rubrobacteraceae bacterium]
MNITRQRARGHYEILETPYAKDYIWVTESEDTEVEVAEAEVAEELLRPWHVEYEEWVREQQVHHEQQQWIEIQALG